MEEISIQRIQEEGLKYLDNFKEFKLICDSYNKKEFTHYNDLIVSKGYVIVSNEDVGKDFEVKIVHYKKKEKWTQAQQETFILNLIYDGYSIIRFDADKSLNEGHPYGACDRPLHFDYTHNGTWGVGNTPFEALFNCYSLKQFKT